VEISIHAPTWGATLLHRVEPLVDEVISIHAPTWGATVAFQVPSDSSASFQSTHPRGVRQNRCPSIRRLFQFQSTHPRGVRLHSNNSISYCLIFQSTHPRGVRRSRSRHPFLRSRYFNPRTHVGCDCRSR